MILQNLKQKEDWELPNEHFDYICNNYDVNPKIDACASKQNSKLPIFITKKQNVLELDLKRDFYINPPYKKKGLNKNHKTGGKYFNKQGIEDFKICIHSTS
ncbi:MAG: hypothetical protein HRO68_01045 [Nitrosopumilus sp.]|nr:hypothetical protein [Nitrosopumilus sp.]